MLLLTFMEDMEMVWDMVPMVDMELDTPPSDMVLDTPPLDMVLDTPPLDTPHMDVVFMEELEDTPLLDTPV